MTDEEVNTILEELNNVSIEKLNTEAKRLFEAIMKIADERDLAIQKLKENANISDERNNLLVENQKKDKTMNRMAKAILKNEKIRDKLCTYERNEKCKEMSCEDCILEYFKKEG